MALFKNKLIIFRNDLHQPVRPALRSRFTAEAQRTLRSRRDKRRRGEAPLFLSASPQRSLRLCGEPGSNIRTLSCKVIKLFLNKSYAASCSHRKRALRSLKRKSKKPK